MYGGGACPGPVCSPCRKDGISEPGLRQQDLQPCSSWYLVICTEGRTAMLFGVCIGGMHRGYRNPMAVVSYAAGGDTAYGGAAVSRKCYARRETAGSTAVYSLYYRFFLDGYGVTIFPECNVYLCINSCVFREKVI